MTELLKTPLYQHHQSAAGKIVDFGGWALPVNYGSQIEEHHSVRNDCGVFDVSHMTVSDITGNQVLEFLAYLLSNDIAKAATTPGKAIYSCMLNHDGGVIDDLIVYFLSAQHCRLVTNAGTRAKDMAWIGQHANEFDVVFEPRPELALLAVQGPNAIAKCSGILNGTFDELLPSLARFQGGFAGSSEQQNFAGRTGYTGEDGIEFIVSAETAVALWQELLQAGVKPCGLGARDTLRLESGMSLYGNDLDEDHTPFESGIGWCVAAKDQRNFIGKQSLEKTPSKQLIGLILQDRGVLRSHQEVLIHGQVVGEITSGTFSPTLQQSIALARIDNKSNLTVGDQLQIAVRNKHLNAVVANSPFVKNGQATN